MEIYKGRDIIWSLTCWCSDSGQQTQAQDTVFLLETGLRLLSSQEPSSWAKNLVCIKYAHNSYPSAATRFMAFQTVHGYQPPLFFSQDGEAQAPSAYALVHCCPTDPPQDVTVVYALGQPALYPGP